MRLRSSTTLEQAEASGSEAEGTMQEDNYSTQAVWGSPIPESGSPINRHLSPSSRLGEAGPSNSVPTHYNSGQQSYPETLHPGRDFLLYDSWRNDSADYTNDEEQTSKSQSPSIHIQSRSDPYTTLNPSSQLPLAAPTPPRHHHGDPAGDHGYGEQRQPLAPLQTSPPMDPMERYTRGREAWSPAAPISAERRREMLTEDVPGLKRERDYDDKMEEDLTKLAEEERRRKRPRKRSHGASSSTDTQDSWRGWESDRDRRGGRRGSGQAI